MVPVTAHQLLSAVKFDGIIVGKSNKVAVNIAILVETAVKVKVAGSGNAVVPPFKVTAANIVVADHSGFGFPGGNALRTVGMSVTP